MGPERAAVSVLARLAGVGCINAMGPLTCNRSTNATAGQGSRAAVRALTRATAPARSSEAHGGGAAWPLLPSEATANFAEALRSAVWLL